MEVCLGNFSIPLWKFNFAVYILSFVYLINEMTLESDLVKVITYLIIPIIILLSARIISFVEISEEYKIRKIAYFDFFIRVIGWLCIFNSLRFYDKKALVIVLISIGVVCYILNMFFEKNINKILKDIHISYIDIDADYKDIVKNIEYKEAKHNYNQIKTYRFKMIMIAIFGISIMLSQREELSLSPVPIIISFLISAFIMAKYYYEISLFYKSYKIKQLIINTGLSIIGYILGFLIFNELGIMTSLIIFIAFNYRLDIASRKLLINKGRVLYKVMKHNLSNE